MRTLVVVGLVTVSGCWHEKPVGVEPSSSDATAQVIITPPGTPAPPPRHFQRHSNPDCFSLVPAMEQIFTRYQAGFGAGMSEVIDAVTNSCIEDAWSTDLIECFVSAGDGSTVATDRRAEECAKTLTHVQMEGFQRRLMEAMTKNIQPSLPPTPSPTAQPTIPDPDDP